MERDGKRELQSVYAERRVHIAVPRYPRHDAACDLEAGPRPATGGQEAYPRSIVALTSTARGFAAFAGTCSKALLTLNGIVMSVRRQGFSARCEDQNNAPAESTRRDRTVRLATPTPLPRGWRRGRGAFRRSTVQSELQEVMSNSFSREKYTVTDERYSHGQCAPAEQPHAYTPQAGYSPLEPQLTPIWSSIFRPEGTGETSLLRSRPFGSRGQRWVGSIWCRGSARYISQC